VFGEAGKGGFWRVDEGIAKSEIDFSPKAVAAEGAPYHTPARNTKHCASLCSFTSIRTCLFWPFCWCLFNLKVTR
jgi:hypothetical protein